MDMFLYQIRRGVAKSIGIVVVGKAINVLLGPLQMTIILIIGRNPIIMRICHIILTALPKRAQKYQNAILFGPVFRIPFRKSKVKLDFCNFFGKT